MFSPSEYLTNLRQISLINWLVSPPGQMPALPPLPKMSPGGAAIPVVATVPTSSEQCNDLIATLASSSLTLKVAAILGAALLLTYLVRKHGTTILASIRGKIGSILVAVKNKISKQRTVYLLPVPQSVVIG